MTLDLVLRRPHGKKGMGNAAVSAALAADIAIALLKFWAAHSSGSSAMLSEGVHSSVDAVTELLLLYGLRASHRRSTPQHPIGFGREVFFWNFIVALTILALGAGVALFDGLRQIAQPRPVEAPLISLSVLGLSLLVEAIAITVAIRGARAARPSAGLWASLRRSRDATLLTVLISGASGMLGLLLAAAGVLLSGALRNAAWDGIASVAIAVILGVTALALARGTKDLLIGVPAAPDKVSDILALAATDAMVETANGAITIHLAPDQILVAVSLAYRPDCSAAEVQSSVAKLDHRIALAHPDVIAFLVKPETAERYREVQRARGW